VRQRGDQRWRTPAAFALSALLLTSCASSRRSLPSPPLTPAAALAAVREREGQIRTLRARFSARIEHPGGQRTVDGVLVVKKPDRFRVRLVLPLGLTVYDYLSVGENIWVEIPGAGGSAQHRPEAGRFSRDDLGAIFLRRTDGSRGPCEVVGKAAGVYAECPPGAPTRWVLRIHQVSGTILEEAVIEDGEPRLVARYDDYRWADGYELPRRIELRYPRESSSVAIEVLRYEVNRELPDDLFEPLKR
jgi:hypothetical protein